MDDLQIPAEAIVVGIDGSEPSSRALAWAAEQADREDRPLVILHALGAVDPYWMVQPVVDVQALKDSMAAGAEELLAAGRDVVVTAHPDLEVITGWKSEDARHLLIDATERATMVVVGSHGRGPVKRLLLGSVSGSLTRHAHCPVAVVRPGRGQSGGGVLVGVDGTEQSVPTLEQAFRLAESRATGVTVVHCFWDGEAVEHGAALVDATDERYAAPRMIVESTLAGFRDRHAGVPLTIRLAHGLVDDILLELAEGMDIAVVGSRERSTLGDLVLGSVAGVLVEHAACTVVVVPRP